MADILFVRPTVVERCTAEDLPRLLARDDGFLWVDVPDCREDDAHLLVDAFHFHPMAVQACLARNHVPTLHAYEAYVFVVVHTPESGAAGHVHLLELDQFVGQRYLVTVHGPLNPMAPADAALTETRATLERIELGRAHPGSPAELSYAITSAVARRQRAFIDTVARKVATLEERVMASDFRDPDVLLDEMFRVRHELLTVRTMSAQTHDIYARMAGLTRLTPATARPVAEDLADQFDRVRSLADGEKEFLFGVIDLYQTRVTTKMTLAMERLAVLAAVTLPVTALASVYGMNVIVNDRTRVAQLALVLVIMATISVLLLRWTRRQGWW